MLSLPPSRHAAFHQGCVERHAIFLGSYCSLAPAHVFLQGEARAKSRLPFLFYVSRNAREIAYTCFLSLSQSFGLRFRYQVTDPRGHS